MIVLPDSRATAWLAIPIGAVIVLFVSGLSLAVASANAIYRDIEFVVAALLLPLFFLTPILYSLDNLPGADTHPWLVDLIQWGNPLTPLVECFRAPLFLGEVPSTGDLVYLVVETIVALVARRRSCSRRSTTGSPRKCDGDPAVEQPVVAGVGRQPEVRRRLDAVEE